MSHYSFFHPSQCQKHSAKEGDNAYRRVKSVPFDLGFYGNGNQRDNSHLRNSANSRVTPHQSDAPQQSVTPQQSEELSSAMQKAVRRTSYRQVRLVNPREHD